MMGDVFKQNQYVILQSSLIYLQFHLFLQDT